jgi:hypothetical protein
MARLDLRCAEFNATVIGRLDERRLCSAVLYKELFVTPEDLEGRTAVTSRHVLIASSASLIETHPQT